MTQVPIASKEDLVYSESNNFFRLHRIIKAMNATGGFEPLLHWQCGNGAFVRYCRLNGYVRCEGFDMANPLFKKQIKPESALTILVVNQFDSLEKLEWHLQYITEKLMFGGALIIENPFYHESQGGVKIGLEWTEFMAFMEKKKYVHQFNAAVNMPLFASKNNGSKVRR